jgi:hypothetical protein
VAVSAKLYGKFFNAYTAKDVDLDNDTIKAMLCTSTYVPNQDTHEFKSDVTNEVTGTGYTTGGATLSGVSVSYTGASNTWAFDANDVSWAASTITARYLVLYDSTPGSDATRRLIAYVDFGADVTTTAGTLTVTWATAGIVTVTVA